MSTGITRRALLCDLGKTGLAIALLGACSPRQLTVGEAGAWRRVDLGFVSAYVVVHNSVIAVVDTGDSGSADAIEGVIDGIALSWDDVGHVIVTHAHPDHVGSLAEVMARAPAAEVYAGEADIPSIESTRPVTAVGDGDRVMSLEIIATPGHTPGHVSVLDPGLSLLLAGDALVGADGGVSGPDPRFSDDLAVATGSVGKLAGLSYDTVVFGHGEPVESDASAQVAELVATG